MNLYLRVSMMIISLLVVRPKGLRILLLSPYLALDLLFYQILHRLIRKIINRKNFWVDIWRIFTKNITKMRKKSLYIIIKVYWPFSISKSKSKSRTTAEWENECRGFSIFIDGAILKMCRNEGGGRSTTSKLLRDIFIERRIYKNLSRALFYLTRFLKLNTILALAGGVNRYF